MRQWLLIVLALGLGALYVALHQSTFFPHHPQTAPPASTTTTQGPDYTGRKDKLTIVGVVDLSALCKEKTLRTHCKDLRPTVSLRSSAGALIASSRASATGAFKLHATIVIGSAYRLASYLSYHGLRRRSQVDQVVTARPRATLRYIVSYTQ